MNYRMRWGLLAGFLVLAGGTAPGYIDIAYSLGRIIKESTNIMVLQIESVDRERNLIVFRKVRDIKGRHPDDVVRNEIGQLGMHPREKVMIMSWAEVGKPAVFFHNGSAGEICADRYWYQVLPGAWWRLFHAEPIFLMAYCGKPERLASMLEAMLAGQEVVVPCMQGGNFETLSTVSAKMMRMKASAAIQDYNAERDFVGWGVEEFQRILGMPGFTHTTTLAPVSPGAAGVTGADFNGDGRPDLCLYGEGGALLLENAGAAFNEVALPAVQSARAAEWADFNRDNRPDLLLATPSGPRLFVNEGKGFRDASNAMPAQEYYNLRAAAWIDADADGRPDILLADGFRGLRLYRNLGDGAVGTTAPGIGPWYYAGPFDNSGGRGFDTTYPPEQGVDLRARYAGKNGADVSWREGKFRDGTINSLCLFGPAGNENSVVYLYREIDMGGIASLPVSFGSDDTLTVWFNEQKLHAQNVAQGCAPDQVKLTLNLRPGRNRLMLKICQGTGDFAFYFSATSPSAAMPPLFEDVSDGMRLGERGVAGGVKGDRVCTADVDGDGRQDFLYSAGRGVLVLNRPGGFVAAEKCGIEFAAGGVTPVFGRLNADELPDLFVPQRGAASRLFLNLGKGRFRDVTVQSGAAGNCVAEATCGAWTGPAAGSGAQDLMVGCWRGPNLYFRNKGDGTFTDASAGFGFHQRIFNTSGMLVSDLNRDGAMDLALNNERQKPAILLGDPSTPSLSGEPK